MRSSISSRPSDVVSTLLVDASDFHRATYMLAIRRAARDAHRSECDLDAVGCEVCREHARDIAEAKRALNHFSEALV